MAYLVPLPFLNRDVQTFAAPTYVQTTITTTSGSTTATVSSAAGISSGMNLSCSNINPGTTITFANTIANSTITLGGLLKHMTFVENEWFWRWVGDNDRLEPWLSADFANEPDWEFISASEESAATLMSNWQASINLSESVLDGCLQAGGLDQLAKRKWPNDESPSLRWILVHMIEEYARHNGHADFIRESIDGSVGE
jgi:uncharacterized damage-inducible protein DinB